MYSYKNIIFYLKTTKPFPDNNLSLKLCKFEGKLVDLISFGI